MAAILGVSPVDELSGVVNIRSHSCVECVHMDVGLILFVSKTVRANVEVSLKQFFAPVAMIVDIGELFATKLAKVIIAKGINMIR